MAVLRLFAAAREAAGTATEQVPGATVDEVLDAARRRHGDQFARVLAQSKVWCNGSPATGDQVVGPGDEVAVLPPVSGGSGPPSFPRPSGMASRAPDDRPPRPASPPRRLGRLRAGHRARSRRPAVGAGRPTRTATGSRDRPGAHSSDGPDAVASDGLTRLPALPVPRSGKVAIGGRERPVMRTGPRRTPVGRRYAVVYDTSGHKVTLGVVWFLAVIGALALGWAPLTLLFGVAAGWAALEAASRSVEAGRSADPWVAGLGGAAIGASGAAGSGYLGGAILLVVLVALIVAAITTSRERVLGAAGSSVLSTVPFGLASACVLLTRDLEIGAAVVLVLFVSVYEAGDFLIGSGAANSVEGPLVGGVTIVITGLVVFVLRVPPFDGAPALVFAAIAAVTAPVGQLACSAVLPAPDAHAPAARRLDSLLLLAPLWAFASGLFVASQA